MRSAFSRFLSRCPRPPLHGLSRSRAGTRDTSGRAIARIHGIGRRWRNWSAYRRMEADQAAIRGIRFRSNARLSQQLRMRGSSGNTNMEAGKRNRRLPAMPNLPTTDQTAFQARTVTIRLPFSFHLGRSGTYSYHGKFAQRFESVSPAQDWRYVASATD